VIVTCIFLNKTAAIRARPFLKAFLEHYPSPDSLRGADPKAIKETYFNTLELFCRAWWLVSLADQLLDDPPLPHALRKKTYCNARPPSEVAHLSGVGEYASDAWRLFCKKSFYADYDEDVEEEWRTLNPKDKDLRRYVRRKRREEQISLLTADITTRMAGVTLGNSPAGGTRVILGSGVRVRRVARVVASAS
jgi:hypothetical protein